MGHGIVVIIPVHDAESTIGEQLEALVDQIDAPDFEVVVVLNRCTDDSARIAGGYASRLRLRVVEANSHPSAAYARNVGAANSSAPILLFCDADDRVDRGWVSQLGAPLRHRRADFAGGKIVIDQNGLPGWLYRWRYEALDEKCVHSGPGGLEYVMSASLACRREAFEAVGGFDEAFGGAGFEEVDFAARLLRDGFRIGESPKALVTYRPRTSFRSVLRQVRSYAIGRVTLEASEGRLGRGLSRPAIAERVIKSTMSNLVRRRILDPRVLIGKAVERFTTLDAHRRWAADNPNVIGAIPAAADFVAPLKTALIGGLALCAYPSRAQWYRSSGIEHKSLALVEALLPTRGTFVDCGANVGVFTLAAALKVGDGGQVIAFEPDPRTNVLLHENLRRHHVANRVQVSAEGVGDLAEPRAFIQYENDVVSGFAVAPTQFSPGATVSELLVDVVRLDDVIQQPVDMIKIDVEGFEPAVLAGAQALLARCPEALIIAELNPAALRSAGRKVGDLLSWFPEDRWVLWLVDEFAELEQNSIRRLDRNTLASLSSSEPGWFGNLLAVPASRADAVAELMSIC